MAVQGHFLASGRVRDGAFTPKRTSLSACSDEDPDLWVWEAFYFKAICKNRMKDYQHFSGDPNNWLSRMEGRGFKNPRASTIRYPSKAQQELAAKNRRQQTWGSADVNSNTEWQVSDTHGATVGTLQDGHQRRRKPSKLASQSIGGANRLALGGQAFHAE